MSRLKKWEKNFNVEATGDMQQRYKAKMREQLAVHFEIAVQLENAVKKIMGESGLPTWHNIPYLNFGRKLYKLYTRFGGPMLEREVKLQIRLARQNQLKLTLLRKIRNAVQEMAGPTP